MPDQETSAVRLAEKRALEARMDARQLGQQNAKLQETLKVARERLQAARRQLEAMSAPPLSFATVLAREGECLDVDIQGRRLRVAVDPDLQTASVTAGRTVLLNESMVVVATANAADTGQLAVVREMVGEQRLIVAAANGEDRVVEMTPSMVRAGVRHGDSVVLDPRGRLAVARVPREDVEDVVLEQVPDLDYSAIGGLSAQIEQVRDAVELPFLHRDLYRTYGLEAPKGILLYGPPGCGKTMIAKAVARSLADSLPSGASGTAYFFNIKGPELLNKYVGETERQIRVIFQRARERASAGTPVIIFFDEMDSLFRTRGSGVSSDVENTIVPQLLSEIDGVESLANVIIIGASNREDMIDPAILRPGRLDVKIKLDRPGAEAAREIFAKYLTPDVPLHADEGDPDAARARMIGAVVDHVYAISRENEFLEVTYAGGDKETLYFKDFASGAMISNVVGRAKQNAIKREITTGVRGVTTEDLTSAALAEFRENEDLPNTTNPDDWARISGRKGEKIVYIRTLVGDARGAGRAVEQR